MITDQVQVDKVSGQTTTGHEWDGIRELNTPLPRWWLWIFYACIAWAFVYWIFYPSWPLANNFVPGVLGHTNRAAVLADVAFSNQVRKEMTADLQKATLQQIADNPKMLELALAEGKAVLCEKPFAFNAAEGAALLAAAQAAGVVHMVAHEFRWMPDRALFGRAIADGLIGEPRFLVIDQFIPFCADPATRLPGWWWSRRRARLRPARATAWW